MQRQCLVIGLVLLSSPCALALGQQSVCVKGDSVEVFVDRKWWPGRVMDVPRNEECADGTTQRSLIHPWSGEESDPRPSSVNIGGHTYTRETR